MCVTLSFVVRAVESWLLEINLGGRRVDGVVGRQQPEKSLSRRFVLPSVTSVLLSVAGLVFLRAIGDFGSVVLIGGAVPGKTSVLSQWIQTLIENGDRTGATAI